MNDPESNAIDFQNALRTMSYMGSQSFGEHAEMQLAGNLANKQATESPREQRKSRIEQMIEKAVQAVVEGVTKAVDKQEPQARQQRTDLPAPEKKQYQGNVVDFLRAEQPVARVDVPEIPRQQEAQPQDLGGYTRQAVDTQQDIPVFSERSPSLTVPDAGTFAPGEVASFDAQGPRMAPTYTPQATSPVRPPHLDAIADQLPDRPLASMARGSGAVPPPRMDRPNRSQPFEVPQGMNRPGSPDPQGQAEWGSLNTQEIRQREQHMEGADVVSDFAMTTSMFYSLILSHIANLTDQVKSHTIALDRLTEDYDQ